MKLDKRLKGIAKRAKLTWSKELYSPGWFMPTEKRIYLNKEAIIAEGLDVNAVFLHELIHWSGVKLERTTLLMYSHFRHEEESIAHKGALELAKALGLTLSDKSVQDMLEVLDVYKTRACQKTVDEGIKEAVDFLIKLI